MAVFSGNVEDDIKFMWDRINLAISLHCLPSQIDNESHKDMEAVKVILSARNEKAQAASKTRN